MNPPDASVADGVSDSLGARAMLIARLSDAVAYIWTGAQPGNVPNCRHGRAHAAAGRLLRHAGGAAPSRSFRAWTKPKRGCLRLSDVGRRGRRFLHVELWNRSCHSSCHFARRRYDNRGDRTAGRRESRRFATGLIKGAKQALTVSRKQLIYRNALTDSAGAESYGSAC